MHASIRPSQLPMSIEHYILPNEGDPLVSDDGNSFAIVMNLNTLTRPKRAPTNSIYRGIYSVSHTHTLYHYEFDH